MWIVQEQNKVALWNKRHFKEKKTEIMRHFKNIQYWYLLNKYLKFSLWRLAVRYDIYHIYIYIYIYMSLGGKGLVSTLNFTSVRKIGFFLFLRLCFRRSGSQDHTHSVCQLYSSSFAQTSHKHVNIKPRETQNQTKTETLRALIHSFSFTGERNEMNWKKKTRK
jgi:hypothetical protein